LLDGSLLMVGGRAHVVYSYAERMKMDENERQEALDSFLAEHGEHYELRAPLGEGACGFTYRGIDRRRGIDVCVKFFIGGVAPVGAHRDWRVTSQLKNDLVCDTFTVEHFSPSANGQAPRVAVVSRFIPGMDLGEIVDRFRRMSPADQSELEEAFVAEIGGDLCTAVCACHSAGHGHGDLSERNVMVSMHSDALGGWGRRFRAVLIDFDNASYKPALRDLEESKLKEKDLSSLVRLLGLLTYESRWHEGFQKVLRCCDSAASIHESFDFLLRICGIGADGSSGKFGPAHWNYVLRYHLALTLAYRSHATPLRGFIREVAVGVGCEALLESEGDALQLRVLNDPDYPGMSMSVETRTKSVFDSLRRLFE
jgi:serine/threonine protein kinase